MSDVVGRRKVSTTAYKRKAKEKTQKKSKLLSEVPKMNNIFLRREKVECHTENILTYF